MKFVVPSPTLPEGEGARNGMCIAYRFLFVFCKNSLFGGDSQSYWIEIWGFKKS
jgi:hypothetical protein